MMSKDFLKKAGILGVSFGLMASPLAFADQGQQGEEDYEPTPQEEPMEEEGTSYNNFDESQDEDTEGEYDTEYENEEEEHTLSYEEDKSDDEEGEWDTEDDDS